MRFYYEKFGRPASVTELNDLVEASKSKLKKSGKKLDLIVVNSWKLTKTWWGNAWCENLMRYANMANRLERGKRYVINGCVIDLQIEKGEIKAKVQGSSKTPYNVSIKVAQLSNERKDRIINSCMQKIENIESLIKGEFPEEMKNLFFDQKGIFPTKKEIVFDCDCPDSVEICKHAAAAFYGVGVRLDENPLLFFELRGIDVNAFVEEAVTNQVEMMLKNANKKSKRIIEDDEFVLKLIDGGN